MAGGVWYSTGVITPYHDIYNPRPTHTWDFTPENIVDILTTLPEETIANLNVPYITEMLSGIYTMEELQQIAMGLLGDTGYNIPSMEEFNLQYEDLIIRMEELSSQMSGFEFPSFEFPQWEFPQFEFPQWEGFGQMGDLFSGFELKLDELFGGFSEQLSGLMGGFGGLGGFGDMFGGIFDPLGIRENGWKMWVLVGLAIAVTIALAYGAYKIAKSKEVQKTIRHAGATISGSGKKYMGKGMM